MEFSEFVEEIKIAIDADEEININGETDLKALDFFDSLAHLGIIVLFDSEFGITLTIDQLLSNTVLKDLYKLTKNI
tara:strand:+ start:291 stop:518 length:228 start_codon:yes stop_codon:yes gene_type:complete